MKNKKEKTIGDFVIVKKNSIKFDIIGYVLETSQGKKDLSDFVEKYCKND